MTRLDPSYVHTAEITDGDLVALIVSRMREELPDIHSAFIAYYLHVVDGQRHPKKRMKDLAGMMGIAPRTLRSRRLQGFEYVKNQLDCFLDRDAAFLV